MKAARLDQLTGLANRSLFHERLLTAMNHFRRNNSRQFALMFLDFDRFKLVNDSLGHDVGDLLLKEIAVRLRRHVRSTDEITVETSAATVARLGGDEFVVLAEDIRSPRDAVCLAQRLLDVCGEPYDLNGQVVQSSASIGIVCSDLKYRTADEMLRDADIAMYQAKARGKAQYVIFDASMQQAVRDRVQIEEDLRIALAENQFVLHYQPIVSLTDGHLSSVEALARWNHPTRGIVSPKQFISIAEETRLILPLSLWVLREACHQFVEWKTKFPETAPAYVSVNLSRIQLAEATLVSQVMEIISATGIHPEQLQLEVTESEIMENAHAAREMLNALKAEGIRLAMDDFGTGHSSLACLHEFPFDVLKIDQAFIRNFDRGRAFIALANSIVSLADNLGMECVAEGIETIDQIATLQAMGCTCGQGYYFGKPVSVEVLMKGEWRASSLASSTAVQSDW
ncbi:MAG: bifunctional diguanylate cyclase/phosphodiesterase [Planctomycetaceae bacterium]